MSGKSRTIWDFTVSRPTQIWPTNENPKSRTSPTVWDGRRQIRRIGSASIFPTRPRFLRWSAGDHSRYMKTSIFAVGDVGDSFSSLPILFRDKQLKLLVSSFPCPSQIKTVSIIVDPDDSDPRFCRYISKIWDGRETVKSPIVWDFSDI